MFPKCAGCGSRILVGGHSYVDQRFCTPECITRFQVAQVGSTVPREFLDEQVQKLFASNCPNCGQPAKLDIYNATRVTGMLVMFKVKSEKALACASCGRKHRLRAAGHCLAAGWWSPKAAVCNLFVLPTNVIAAALIRTPREPSVKLRALVKEQIAKSVFDQMHAKKAPESATAKSNS